MSRVILAGEEINVPGCPASRAEVIEALSAEIPAGNLFIYKCLSLPVIRILQDSGYMDTRFFPVTETIEQGDIIFYIGREFILHINEPEDKCTEDGKMPKRK